MTTAEFIPPFEPTRGRLSEASLAAIAHNPDSETHFVPVFTADAGYRRLAVEVTGPEDGYPVVAHHGSPGSRLGPKPDREILEETGVRLYTYDRPGYGNSTANPGRLPADSRHDVAAICSWFRLEGVASIGRSAGGEHALSTHSLPEVERIAVLAGSAPQEAVGSARFKGLAEANTKSFEEAAQKQRAGLDELVLKMQQEPEYLLDTHIVNGITDADRAILPLIRDALIKSHKEGVRPGSQGWWDDQTGLTTWGFDPRESRTETFIWSGTNDTFVRPVEQDTLHRLIPHATLVRDPEGAHFTTYAPSVMSAVLRWCVTGELTDGWRDMVVQKSP